MWPLVPVFSEQAERGAPLAYLIMYDIYFLGGVIGSVLVTAIKEIALLNEYERNRVSKANKEIESHDISY